ncbi:hypothetical protein N781_13710 [Pontibacillus halophilus JSM 076056 = DSM 19796]|uniref:PDZ domain-containing protein n=1 Tax=Pontibacillus halophilus JSM 076056 = DSM 19796 TaxID=1385510 RepID=A0A0A5GPI0_9BACI|nr:PDZ domain-containing protein [Pontibacillus halophilus]KGX93050.1 hypothetical protein N781_13710 [Pontibacillus halophilus JSM 076056 = DSM 19796]
MFDWFIEILKGVGKFFLNPITYWSIVIVLLTSIRRIKLERKDFGTRIFDPFAEWSHTWFISMVTGAILSVLIVGTGFVVSLEMMVAISIAMLVSSLWTRFHLLSPAYTIFLAGLLLWGASYVEVTFMPTSWTTNWEGYELAPVVILLGLLLLYEGMLMVRQPYDQSYPQYVKSSRGKLIGQHRIKKFSVLPLFFIVPGGALTSFAPWWPLFNLGGNEYGLIALPMYIGFEQVFRGFAPEEGAKRLGKQVIGLSVITTVLGVVGLWLSPMYMMISLLVVFLLRVAIAYVLYKKDRGISPFFTPRSEGLPVLGIIPGSPAHKMGILIGERIEKVNGLSVYDEESFYHALQANRAFTKVDVRDSNGEIRFTQQAMYEGDHHELGLLFVKEKKRRDDVR